MKRSFIVLSLIAVSGMIAAGCAGPPPAPTGAPPTAPPQATAAPPTKAAPPTTAPPTATAKPAQPVVVLQGVEVTTMDPHFFTNTPQWNVLTHVFDTLTELNFETGQVVPKMAESWEVRNPTTWRFKLRKGITFQNGESFNAEVVKYNLDRLVDPKVNAQKWFFVTDSDYASSIVVDEYTIDIVTKAPSVVVADNLTRTAIVPKKYYSEAPLEQLAAKPIGSGPYKVTEWVKDDHTTLQRWDGYWGTKPTIETVIWRTVPELSTRISELLSGGADLIVNVAPDQTGSIETAACCEVRGIAGGRDIFAMIDVSFAPFKDQKVRQALNYAVDKQGILNAFFKGKGKLLAGVANASWENTNLKPYPYDPAKAKALLTEAGFAPGSDGVLQKDGQPVKLKMNTPVGRYMKDKEVAQAVAADLKKVGISVDIEPLEWSVLTARQRGGDLAPLTLLGLGGFFNGVGELRWTNPDYQFSPRDPQIRWQSKEYVDLYAKMRAEMDPTQRKALADKLQELAFEGAPWIFLYKQYDFYGVNKRLNWKPRPDEFIILSNVQVTGTR